MLTYKIINEDMELRFDDIHITSRNMREVVVASLDEVANYFILIVRFIIVGEVSNVVKKSNLLRPTLRRFRESPKRRCHGIYVVTCLRQQNPVSTNISWGPSST